ncbi:MAG: helix-turn-helix domain-containing protein [Lachnospiraceae bacterium]
MYRILLADDEGITIDSITFLLEKNFPGCCEIRSARTGRSVIETAEVFRPDIAVMDICMPGINGIDAIREIRKFCPTTVFVVLSAYSKFDYAKDAIDLGVLSYLTKPLDRDVFLETMRNAMNQIDRSRERRSDELRTREKLETVIPVIENGLVCSLVLQDYEPEVVENYCALLDLHEKYAYLILVECGEKEDAGTPGGQGADDLHNPIGTGIRIQQYYSGIRETVKEFYPGAVIGQIMMNKIPILIPHESSREDYAGRIRTIDRARLLIGRLEEKTGVYFRLGIGSVRPLEEMSVSYQEAIRSLSVGTGPVSHADDLPVACGYEDDYPIDIERELFGAVKKGDADGAADAAEKFYSWMENTQLPQLETPVRMKTLEFILWAEHISYQDGGMGTYRFRDRQEYLPNTVNLPIPELHRLFVSKIRAAAQNLASKSQNSAASLVSTAKAYIDDHYQSDLSLDEISRNLNISPYYFSKLFKEEAGITFIEYLTKARLSHARELLSQGTIPVKDVCTAVGYQDPNYFSRLFRRSEGVSPSEYREGKRRQ